MLVIVKTPGFMHFYTFQNEFFCYSLREFNRWLPRPTQHQKKQQRKKNRANICDEQKLIAEFLFKIATKPLPVYELIMNSLNLNVRQNNFFKVSLYVCFLFIVAVLDCNVFYGENPLEMLATRLFRYNWSHWWKHSIRGEWNCTLLLPLVGTARACECARVDVTVQNLAAAWYSAESKHQQNTHDGYIPYVGSRIASVLCGLHLDALWMNKCAVIIHIEQKRNKQFVKK